MIHELSTKYVVKLLQLVGGSINSDNLTQQREGSILETLRTEHGFDYPWQFAYFLFSESPSFLPAFIQKYIDLTEDHNIGANDKEKTIALVSAALTHLEWGLLEPQLRSLLLPSLLIVFQLSPEQFTSLSEKYGTLKDDTLTNDDNPDTSEYPLAY